MTTRTFLRCTVLSVQDTSILYPSCLTCFSRVTLASEEQASSRWCCVKCGRDAEAAGYRYRLSLRVSRDCAVLGATVFGSCLDSFFGVPAGQLNRFLDAVKESRGVQTVERLLRKALEDCFVGRCVLLAIKIPGNVGEHRSPGRRPCPALEGSMKTSEQYIASSITLPNDGVFGATVLQYLQSLLRARDLSDGCSDQECSQESDQDSYHDYTQLCPGGVCSPPCKAANASFPLPLSLLQSPGSGSASGGSLELSLPRPRGDALDASLPDASVAMAPCSCCDAQKGQVSVSQESGYGETSSSFTILSGSVPSQDQLHSRVSYHQGGSSEPTCSFGSQVACQKDMATSPECLVHDPEEGYNYSAELFDVSGLDSNDFYRSEQVTHRPRTSADFHCIMPGLAPFSQSTPILKKGAPKRKRMSKATDQTKEASHRGLDHGSAQTKGASHRGLDHGSAQTKRASHRGLDHGSEARRRGAGSVIDSQMECTTGDGSWCGADCSKDLFVDSYKD
ncbi:uncharacterized protein ddias [Clupea harengus]|uniref:Uncharacterized protein ddias n=1 Tax=Clupea harengus TaxID=7950 RepID=A0A6P8FXW6_CLUHA|nr:uncharacterized protein ddias [Clupea harengus]